MLVPRRYFQSLAVLGTLSIVTLLASRVGLTSDTSPLPSSSSGLAPTVLTDIVAWISANTDLPAIYDPPRVKFVTPEEMHSAGLRVGSGSGAASIVGVQHQSTSHFEREVDALYDDTRRTIYLKNGWTGTTPAQVSVLVHEMVHHLQNLAQLKYECAQAREALAYAAQEKWLAQFGTTVGKEFGLDPMTILVRTKCMH